MKIVIQREGVGIITLDYSHVGKNGYQLPAGVAYTTQNHLRWSRAGPVDTPRSRHKCKEVGGPQRERLEYT